MLMPKKVKYRKVQKGKIRGLAKGGRTFLFGEYGLVVTQAGRITARQIEAVRVTINRKLKKIGKLYLRMFPNKPVTKKPAETRMGKGKGNPEVWVFVAKRGRVLVEVAGIPRQKAQEILKVASCKLPVRTRFVDKSQLLQVGEG
jgi:large subunit ribosomal protein L16